jgi:hypothetical protein
MIVSVASGNEDAMVGTWCAAHRHVPPVHDDRRLIFVSRFHHVLFFHLHLMPVTPVSRQGSFSYMALISVLLGRWAYTSAHTP